jgi:hypothetical protein
LDKTSVSFRIENGSTYQIFIGGVLAEGGQHVVKILLVDEPVAVLSN